MPSQPSIAERVREVQDRIAQAAGRAGRSAGSVRLLAVSKTVEPQFILEAYETGIRDFGENRVQEALEKMPTFPHDIRWHFIGRLQRNKINKILGKFTLIHSVDSYETAQAVSERLGEGRQEVLLEVNTSGEASKAGVRMEGTLELAEKISGLKGILLRGLMTIGPLTDEKQRQREAFRNLKGLFEKVKARGADPGFFSVLSMGMTTDYEMAVEEGSTLVRVGTGIFGSRK